jgi:ABC-2 type transport system ATP-binding protein
MLDVVDLHKRFGPVQALCGMALQVRPGEIVGLIGHNGAGKSTLVEVVLGLIWADRGTVRLDGAEITRGARARIGVSPQELALYRAATVREHLRLFGGLAGLRGRRLPSRIDDVIGELGLGGVADRRAGLLSGGQQRRTQAACALIGDPTLLLLDEPTAGADPSTRQMLLKAVQRRAEAGAAVLYTTHYLPELVELGATVAVARAGRVVARGEQRELLAGLAGELRLRFDGRVPSPAGYDGRREGAELVIYAVDPGRLLPRLITELASSGAVPAAVEVRRPDLDDLYRALDAADARAEVA